MTHEGMIDTFRTDTGYFTDTGTGFAGTSDFAGTRDFIGAVANKQPKDLIGSISEEV